MELNLSIIEILLSIIENFRFFFRSGGAFQVNHMCEILLIKKMIYHNWKFSADFKGGEEGGFVVGTPRKSTYRNNYQLKSFMTTNCIQIC